MCNLCLLGGGKLVWNLSPSTSFCKKTHEVGGLVSILKDIGTVVEMVSFAYSLLCGYGYSGLRITLTFLWQMEEVVD